jgi:hypothetical protein
VKTTITPIRITNHFNTKSGQRSYIRSHRLNEKDPLGRASVMLSGLTASPLAEYWDESSAHGALFIGADGMAFAKIPAQTKRLTFQ